jgi:molecular chaperone GrpE (heat shock protein)
MAKRRRRQLIIDKLEGSIKLLDRADDNLQQALNAYFEVGSERGALLEQIRKGVTMVRENLQQFRYEYP